VDYNISVWTRYQEMRNSDVITLAADKLRRDEQNNAEMVDTC
jgi:hypothetical protein